MEKLKSALGAGAAMSVLALAVTLMVNPLTADNGRLDALQALADIHTKPVARPVSSDSAAVTLSARPIFAMTTGTGAYAEKTFQLFGLSVTAKRKAVLVSIDGAEPAWLSVGQVSGDVQLLDVSATGARFDTPLGERTVGINDPAPATAGTAASMTAPGATAPGIGG